MSPTDFPEEGNSRSNLEDDLQYSSDDDDLDVEDEEEDWQEVDNDNITVTVEEQRGHFSADDQVRWQLRNVLTHCNCLKMWFSIYGHIPDWP